MSSPQGQRTAAIRRLIAGRSASERSGVPLESIDAAQLDAAGPHTSDVLNRVAAALDEADRVGATSSGQDAAGYRQARDALLLEVWQVCTKLDNDPTAPLDEDAANALEAIVLIDGSRPSLPIVNGAFDPDHPFAGSWSTTLATAREKLRQPIQAVGRIERDSARGGGYFGTGWVVDSRRGLVLTNRHVVEQLHKHMPDVVSRTGRNYRMRGGVLIDFASEAGSTHTNRFGVVEARVPDVDGPWLRRLDAAVLRIEPTRSGQRIPTAIGVHADPDGPLDRLISFCAIGFPGWTQAHGPQGAKLDWQAILIKTIGHSYGVKRISPGRTHIPLGGVPGDERRWAFGHDLTTMRGSSGSPLLGWLQERPMAFGLHFGGESLDANYAHAFSATVREFRQLGVPFQPIY